MKVYLVVFSDYDVYEIQAVYLSEEAANSHVALAGKKSQLDVDSFEVEEGMPFICYRAELRFGKIQVGRNHLVVTKLPETSVVRASHGNLIAIGFGLTAAEAVEKLERALDEFEG